MSDKDFDRLTKWALLWGIVAIILLVLGAVENDKLSTYAGLVTAALFFWKALPWYRQLIKF